MADLRQNALVNLANAVNSYLHGFSDMPVGKKYAEKIYEIKQAYASVNNTKYDAIIPADTRTEKAGLLTAAAGLIGWVIFFLMMTENTNAQITFIIVLLIAVFVVTKEHLLSVIPLFVYIAAAFMGAVTTVVPIHMAVVALYFLSKMSKKKGNSKKIGNIYESGKANLIRLQKELNSMLPQIRKELQQMEEEWYQENASVLQAEDRKDFMGKDFPPAFWWQVTLEDLYEIDSIFSCNRYGSWESKLVERSQGSEFDASEEYTPLFAQGLVAEGKISKYFPPSQGYKVYDVISRVTGVSATEQTVQYEVPAHSALSRMAVNMSVLGFAGQVDSAYNRGEISSADHRQLANESFALGWLASEYGNEKKTEEMTEYIPIHYHTNFWTGQIVLKAIEGQKVYGLYYYSGQLPHLFENLEAMQTLPIGYIDIDYYNSNPYFLAKFFSEFPNCV